MKESEQPPCVICAKPILDDQPRRTIPPDPVLRDWSHVHRACDNYGVRYCTRCLEPIRDDQPVELIMLIPRWGMRATVHKGCEAVSRCYVDGSPGELRFKGDWFERCRGRAGINGFCLRCGTPLARGPEYECRMMVPVNQAKPPGLLDALRRRHSGGVDKATT